MEKYVLPKYIQDAFRNGTINDDLISSFEVLDLFSDEYFESLNERDILKMKMLYVMYAKAYLTYKMINESVLDEEESSDSKEVAFLLFSMSNGLEDKISEGILDMHDIFISSMKTDDDVYMQAIISKLKLQNIYSYRDTKQYNLLSKYDNIILNYINSKSYEDISNEEYLDLVKCYIIYMKNINSCEYSDELCAQPSFMEATIDSAYIAYQEANKTVEDRIKNRDNNKDTIKVLKRIIKLNEYDRW